MPDITDATPLPQALRALVTMANQEFDGHAEEEFDRLTGIVIRKVVPDANYTRFEWLYGSGWKITGVQIDSVNIIDNEEDFQS